MSDSPISVQLTLWGQASRPDPGSAGARVIDILDALTGLEYFREGFVGSDPLPSDRDAYLAAAAAGRFVGAQGAINHPFMADRQVGGDALFHLVVVFSQGTLGADRLEIEFRERHPDIPLTTELVRDTIRAAGAFFRMSHVAVLPGGYAPEHRATSLRRLALGWCGWVPFAVDPQEAGSAAEVVSMLGGTFLATGPVPFQAYGPGTDAPAIQKAQALELQLNGLGMLPTRAEIARGGWGDATR